MRPVVSDDRERKPDFDLSGVEQGVLHPPGLDVVGECEITSLKPSNAAESGDACEMDLLQLEEGCKFALGASPSVPEPQFSCLRGWHWLESAGFCILRRLSPFPDRAGSELIP
jgi:hypothetical protein